MSKCLWLLTSLIFVTISVKTSAAETPPRAMADILKASTPSDWRGLDPENTLYLDFAKGRVTIELLPFFAPNHVANIKALAREKYWDGLAIVRVQDNYVVQWADPLADQPKRKKSIKTAKATLPAEFDRSYDEKTPFDRLSDGDVYAPQVGFSFGAPVARDPKTHATWLLHCYGAVGAGRDTDINSGGGTELYAVIGHSPRHLDRNVTLAGRIVDGVELLSSLPRGHGALGFYEGKEKPLPIKSIRIAADVPESQRTNIEMLRTDTPLFKELIESRRNRPEEWFHSKAGKIEICNVPLPTRKK